MGYNNSFGNSKKRRGGKGPFLLFFIILAVILITGFIIDKSSDLPKEKISIQTELTTK